MGAHLKLGRPLMIEVHGNDGEPYKFEDLDEVPLLAGLHSTDYRSLIRHPLRYQVLSELHCLHGNLRIGLDLVCAHLDVIRQACA